MVAIRGEYLLRHLEQFLGEASERWQESTAARFQVLLFRAQPDEGVNCLVTYGLSAVELALGSGPSRSAAIELMICADQMIEPKRLAATLIGVGMHALTQGALPDLHQVLPGQGAVHDHPLFEHFYLTSPGYFPAEFDRCAGLMPPIEMVQLLPVSTRERAMIARQGWENFEDAASSGEIDLLLYDRRPEVAA